MLFALVAGPFDPGEFGFQLLDFTQPHDGVRAFHPFGQLRTVLRSFAPNLAAQFIRAAHVESGHKAEPAYDRNTKHRILH